MSPANLAREELSRAYLEKPSIVTIGKFDGVHRGHQSLISSLALEAVKSNLTPIVVTFNPHPSTVLDPSKSINYLCSLDTFGLLDHNHYLKTRFCTSHQI